MLSKEQSDNIARSIAIVDGKFIPDEYIVEFGTVFIEVSDHYIRLGTDQFKIIERDIPRRGYWVEKLPEITID